jgi:tetratricopeptide (TPR) repeat protein
MRKHAHFELGERHLKEGEFEWAIVQFRKAREIYMLSTDKKLRAKSAEMIRICYLAWGKSLEDEADRLSKQGDVRPSLERYRQAAEKYRDGGDEKRLKGLEKKIRKA